MVRLTGFPHLPSSPTSSDFDYLEFFGACCRRPLRGEFEGHLARAKAEGKHEALEEHTETKAASKYGLFPAEPCTVRT